MHVRYKSLYISLPSSAKNDKVLRRLYETWTTTANFWYFHLELDDVIAYLA